jgi:hypothetical protein
MDLHLSVAKGSGVQPDGHTFSNEANNLVESVRDNAARELLRPRLTE